MSRKTSPARIAAFLRAVRETGNQTLACERAKVSRSWVQLHRSADPAFAQAVADAVAAFAASLDAPALQPPRKWRHQDGEELVVRGTGGSAFEGSGGRRVAKRAQIARARLRQWTPRAEGTFLAELARTCNVKASCAAAGLSQVSAYNHRGRWPDFARAWDRVLDDAMLDLECALLERGRNLFSGAAPPDPPALRDMTVSEAIYLLEMHARRRNGEARQWGRPAREPDIEAVRAEVLAKVALVERRDARERARAQRRAAPAPAPG